MKNASTTTNNTVALDLSLSIQSVMPGDMTRLKKRTLNFEAIWPKVSFLFLVEMSHNLIIIQSPATVDKEIHHMYLLMFDFFTLSSTKNQPHVHNKV